MGGRMATVRNAAEKRSLAQDGETGEHAAPANRTVAERRATGAPGVHAIRTAKTLVRRDVALIGSDGGEDDTTHRGAD